MLPVMRLRRVIGCSLEPRPFSDLFGFLLNKNGKRNYDNKNKNADLTFGLIYKR